jgi:hypothetical protein
MPDLNQALTDAISAAKARVHVGYPRWLRPWLARDVIAITLGRTIYVSERALDRLEPLIRHELAHVRQVNRHGLLPFLARYVAEFLGHFWRVRSVSRAYAMISFEIEAAAAEEDEPGTGL